MQGRLQRDPREVHGLTRGAAGANKGAQVTNSHALLASQMAAYSGACVHIHAVSPAVNSQVPKGTRLGLASGLDLLLLPASAASDQGEDRPPAPLLALPSCSVIPCCFILLMKTLKLIYLGCVF